MCDVIWAATVQEDEGVPSEDAYILLVDHLDLALAVTDLIGIGGDADLPLVLVPS